LHGAAVGRISTRAKLLKSPKIQRSTFLFSIRRLGHKEDLPSPPAEPWLNYLGMLVSSRLSIVQSFNPILELSSGPKTCRLRQTKNVCHLFMPLPRAITYLFQVVRVVAVVVVTPGPHSPENAAAAPAAASAAAAPVPARYTLPRRIAGSPICMKQ
jgi:hypothetical protein